MRYLTRYLPVTSSGLRVVYCLYCKDDTCDGGVASEWREEIRHRTQAARRDGQRRSRVVIGCTLGAGADLAQASFAGQHDTYLNIAGTDAHA